MPTSEVFFGAELDFMQWRADNPETFIAIVVLSVCIVAALLLYWHLTERERNITATRIERERARKRRMAARNY